VAVVGAAGVPAIPVMPRRKPSARVLGKEGVDVVLDDPGGPGRIAAKPGCFLSRARGAGELAIERVSTLLKRCGDRLHATIRQIEIRALVVQTSPETSNFSTLWCEQEPQHPARPGSGRVSACSIKLGPRVAYVFFGVLDVARLYGSPAERAVQRSERFALVQQVAGDASRFLTPAHSARPPAGDFR